MFEVCERHVDDCSYNVGERISMLAVTSEVGNGSCALDFVGHFLTKERTPSVVMPENIGI